VPWTVINHDVFDPKRQAIILVAGDKTSVARTRF
jgi:hypothetical protein